MVDMEIRHKGRIIDMVRCGTVSVGRDDRGLLVFRLVEGRLDGPFSATVVDLTVADAIRSIQTMNGMSGVN